MKIWLRPLMKVGESVVAEVKRNPIRTERINEVGNAVELYVLAELEKAALTSGRPTPPSGRKKPPATQIFMRNRETTIITLRLRPTRQRP